MDTRTMVPERLRRHAKKLAIGIVALVLLLPTFGGAVGGGESFFVAVEAPESGDGITILIQKDPGLVGGCEDEADVEILKDDIIVYPSVLGQVEVEDCEGTLEIPYQRFAGENGQYQVEVTMGEDEAQTRFSVEKVVNWVYIRSFPNETEERTRIEVALAQSKAQPLSSSVFTSGELVLDVYWEDCDRQGPLGTGLGVANETQECQAQHDNVFHGTVPLNTTAVTNVIVPWDNFESQKYEEDRPAEGSYNVTATFHNAEARGNENVPMDPTVYREDPPGNWFEVKYE